MWRSVAMTNYYETIHLRLTFGIILIGGGRGMTNYHETIHLGLNCGGQSYEPNMIHI